MPTTLSLNRLRRVDDATEQVTLSPGRIQPVATTTAPPSHLTDYGPDVIRGAAGLVPGGPWGAVASGAADVAAQKWEIAQGRRDRFNPLRTGAEAAIGFVPFGKRIVGGLKGLLQSAGKGAAISGAGNVANQLAETGTVDPEQAGVATAIGGAGGAGAFGLSRWLGRTRPTTERPMPTSDVEILPMHQPGGKASPQRTLPVAEPRRAAAPSPAADLPPIDDEAAHVARTVTNGAKRAAEREARMIPTEEEVRVISPLRERLERIRAGRLEDTPRTRLEQVPDLEPETPAPASPASPARRWLEPDEERAAADAMGGKRQRLNAQEVSEHLRDYGQVLSPTDTPSRLRQLLRKETGGMDKNFRRLVDDERGGVSPEILQRVGLAGASAIAGPIIEPEHPVVGAVGMAALGATGKDLVRRGSLAERLRYAGMLSRPLTHAKVIGGNVISLGQEAAVKALSGQGGTAARLLRETANVPEHIRVGKEAFAHPERFRQRFETDIPQDQGVLTVPQRLIGAYDAATVAAAERAGISTDRARKLAFSNEPESELGKDMVNLVRKHPLAKLVQPFVKTGVNQTERTAEALNLVKALKLRGLERREALARFGLAVGTIGAGAAGVGSSNPATVALAGQYAVPYLAAAALREGAKEGDPLAGASRASERVARDIPGLNPTISPSRTVASYVPGVLQDLNPDPYPRSTAGTRLFGETMRKIPGLSERLKVAGARRYRIRRPVRPARPSARGGSR